MMITVYTTYCTLHTPCIFLTNWKQHVFQVVLWSFRSVELFNLSSFIINMYCYNTAYLLKIFPSKTSIYASMDVKRHCYIKSSTFLNSVSNLLYSKTLYNMYHMKCSYFINIILCAYWIQPPSNSCLIITLCITKITWNYAAG